MTYKKPSSKLHGYLEAICWAHALGTNYKDIAARLADGIVDPSGESLSPVQVTPDAVSLRCKSEEGRKLLTKYRKRVYGDTYKHPIAHAGFRLELLAELVENISGKPCESCGRGGCGSEKASELLRIVAEARREEKQLIDQGRSVTGEPGKPSGPTSGGSQPVSIDRSQVVMLIANGLEELSHTGDLETALAAIRSKQPAIEPAGGADSPPPDGDRPSQP